MTLSGQISRKLIRKEPFEHPEYTFIRKDGSTFPALIFADPVIRSGTLAGFGELSSIYRTGNGMRKRSARARKRYRTLVEKSRDGIVVVQDERIAFVNGALMEMIGYAGEELLGHSVEEFVAPEDGRCCYVQAPGADEW